MKKITLSIGIPAHNEEKNISSLLCSILSQKHSSYVIKNIYVLCDGCTDKTAEIVSEFSKENRKIILTNDGKRKGKAQRLNEIYSKNESELLLTIDADVIFETTNALEILVQSMIQDKQLLLVGPRYVPVQSTTLMGRFAEYSYLSFEDAIIHLNGGNNIYALMGCCSLLKKSFSKEFIYPKGVISDQNFLYLTAIQKNCNSFKLCLDAHILFRTVSSFQDWRLLSTRSIVGDKHSVKVFFGDKIFAREYYMPRKIYALALFKWIIKQPFYTSGSILMNLYIRLFPYTATPVSNGIWETTKTSKEAIYV
ncbi:MAG: hypothetical protein COY81_03560 [Candidatus Pacebacteria bacterium CG_4_10_14_0_8_um_filter_43_12]|nr:MAG: hypothetical protein COY81_03560 [Candidatus Pacebacteria bacterium CG_4_10_14_0_8_um_filter_43_12]